MLKTFQTLKHFLKLFTVHNVQHSQCKNYSKNLHFLNFKVFFQDRNGSFWSTDTSENSNYLSMVLFANSAETFCFQWCTSCLALKKIICKLFWTFEYFYFNRLLNDWTLNCFDYSKRYLLAAFSIMEFRLLIWAFSLLSPICKLLPSSFLQFQRLHVASSWLDIQLSFS